MSASRPARTPAFVLLFVLAVVATHAGFAHAKARVPRGQALLDAVQKARADRRSQVSSVNADVVIGLSSKAWSGSGTCQGRLAARRPGSLRLLGFAAVATVFDATTDGKHFWLYLPTLDRVITGKAEEESLLIALPVLPGEIVSALFGEPYGAPESGLRLIQQKGVEWVAWDLKGGHEVRARYATASMLLQRAELWNGDRRVAQLDYHDYRKRGGVWWPTRIDFDWPAEQGHMSLTFDSVKFGLPIEDKAFRFDVPDGVLVVPVTSGDAFGEGAR